MIPNLYAQYSNRNHKILFFGTVLKKAIYLRVVLPVTIYTYVKLFHYLLPDV